MSKASRDKGKRGEREWAAWLRAEGFTEARRGQQYQGGEHSADVVGVPGVHWEVKRTERLRILNALEQARQESGSNSGAVAWRPNQHGWVIIVDAVELDDFAAAWISAREKQEWGDAVKAMGVTD